MLRPARLWVAILLLVTLAAGVRLYRVGLASFWIDEVSSVQVAVQPLRDIILNYRPGMHPSRGAEQAPLALVVMHLFLSPDVSEASARLPSAVFGAAGVLVLFLFGRAVFSTPLALLAGLFLALSPLHVWYSQEARWYAQWIVLTMLSYWALVSALQSGRASAWAAYGLCTVLSVYTFILSFLVIACQAIAVVLLDRRREHGRRRLPAFLLTQVIVLPTVVPVIWMIVKTLGLTTGTPRPPRVAELPYTFFVYAAGYSSGPTTEFLHSLPTLSRIVMEYPAVTGFAVVFAPLVGIGVRRVLRRPLAAMVLLPWCFGLPLLVFLTSLVSHVTYQARYSSASLPAFLILVAVGILSLERRTLRWGAVAAVLTCFLSSLANYYWNPQYAKEDAKSAVVRIEAAGAASAPVAVIGQVDTAVAYYGPDLRVIPIDTCARDALLHDPLRAAFSDGRGMWLIVGRDWEGAAPQCLQQLARTHAPLERRRFPGIDLWRFKRIDSTSAASISGDGSPIGGGHSTESGRHAS